MRNMTSVAADRVRIAGMDFELRISDGEVCAQAIRLARACFELDLGDPQAILALLHKMADAIDNMLGTGAMLKIADGRPVSMQMCLGALNEIVSQCAHGYRAHVEEYLS